MRRFIYITMWVCIVVAIISLPIAFIDGFDVRFIIHTFTFTLNAVVMFYLHKLLKMKGYDGRQSKAL